MAEEGTAEAATAAAAVAARVVAAAAARVVAVVAARVAATAVATGRSTAVAQAWQSRAHCLAGTGPRHILRLPYHWRRYRSETLPPTRRTSAPARAPPRQWCCPCDRSTSRIGRSQIAWGPPSCACAPSTQVQVAAVAAAAAVARLQPHVGSLPGVVRTAAEGRRPSRGGPRSWVLPSWRLAAARWRAPPHRRTACALRLRRAQRWRSTSCCALRVCLLRSPLWLSSCDLFGCAAPSVACCSGALRCLSRPKSSKLGVGKKTGRKCPIGVQAGMLEIDDEKQLPAVSFGKNWHKLADLVRHTSRSKKSYSTVQLCVWYSSRQRRVPWSPEGPAGPTHGPTS